MSYISKLIEYYYKASHLPEYLAPIMDLGLRLYLADVFFKSGLTKIKNWDSTLYLFSDVYQVPLVNTEVAAYLATSVELGCSVLLVLGLLGRFAASGLFILNLVAVISYADLSQAGINQHLSWGILLGVLLILSNGKYSVDAWLEKRIR